ncbi:type VII toxin-antitoxin system HepT family RNase toxin [Sulfuricystis multivorans]|uniref:type VII toxin-antitoxin system HepT family RNase toxin n=1 Tax=Sulfuricystis multivorans TaxID=2211108 RepID=UPI000F8383B6|nr:DUF86 domain-containing protein [Sulfuricystis multivorans]
MDEVLLGKAGIIERCLKRIDEEYRGHEEELATNFTRQDSILLNLQRACEASIDAAMHLVRRHRLGIPTDSRHAFGLLVQASLLESDLGKHLESMVGFRNIAVHSYRELDIDIVRNILHDRIDDLKRFAAYLVKSGLSETNGL